MQATLISIGDEILIGQIVNTNAAWMGQQLNWAGIKVHEVKVVSDQANHINNALDDALQNSEVVLITGGLGPTKDDITKVTLAKYFNSELVLNEEIWNDIKSYLVKRERPILDSIKSMAMLPEKCEVIRNLRGTAAAMWFEQEGTGKIVMSMPGVPHEMKDFMTRVVIPRLQEKFETPTIVHKVLMCAGLGEAIVAEKIKTVEESLPPHIKLAYLPSMGILRLRLSASGKEEEKIKAEVNKYAEALKTILAPKYIYGEDEELIATTIGKILKAQNATLATAESCTGGLIAHRITSISGSSAYFMGGVVAYSNEQKTNLLGVKPETLAAHGAVSEATVIEMVQGAIKNINVNYALSISGIAGPTGGTPNKPVGTVWIAVGSANSEKVFAQKLQLTQNRDVNVTLSTNLALAMLRRLLLGLL